MVFVSDSTGITVETLGNGLLSQFDHVEFATTTIPFVTDAPHAQDVVTRIEAAGSGEQHDRPLVLCTLANSSLHTILSRSNALVLDIFQAFIGTLEQELHAGSTQALGRFHAVTDDSSYEDRISAVEFPLNPDDGAGTRTYGDAEVMLVGASRSGKTPTCVYPAIQFGIRAANYPLTDETLAGTTYASPSRFRTEVREAEALFERHRIPCLDTSAASVEEIASRVLLRAGQRRNAY